jgi:AAA15 family ATPase/GTPase
MIKINTFEIENFKRIKVFHYDCTGKALTVIGGDNGQGKTSGLDALCFVLGGKQFKPGNVTRDESVVDAHIRVELSNGIVAERKGKNSTLKVFDPSGKAGGQQLLNKFTSHIALNISEFISASDKKKAETLLNIIGIGDELLGFELKEKQLYAERLEIGRMKDLEKKHCEKMTFFEGCPEEPVSATELIEEQQAIFKHNSGNQDLRDNYESLKEQREFAAEDVAKAEKTLAFLKETEDKFRISLINVAQKVDELVDRDPSVVAAGLLDLDNINHKIYTNIDKKKAAKEAAFLKDQYDKLGMDLEEVRIDKLSLIEGASMPLPGLSIEDSKLTYNGQPWDCMSSADQYVVATSIGREENPDCGFVLIDKIETMDLKSLKNFGTYLESAGLQVISTRVSTGPECSIILEDGIVQERKAF